MNSIEIPETIGTRLKKRRKELNLNQNDIAEKLNINRVTYQGYESDKHKPDIDTLVKLADIFQLSIDYIAGRYKQ